LVWFDAALTGYLFGVVFVIALSAWALAFAGLVTTISGTLSRNRRQSGP
jgi:hypothetical protein